MLCGFLLNLSYQVWFSLWTVFSRVRYRVCYACTYTESHIQQAIRNKPIHLLKQFCYPRIVFKNSISTKWIITSHSSPISEHKKTMMHSDWTCTNLWRENCKCDPKLTYRYNYLLRQYRYKWTKNNMHECPSIQKYHSLSKYQQQRNQKQYDSRVKEWT